MLVKSKTQPHCISAKTNILGRKQSISNTERPGKKKCRNYCLVFIPRILSPSVSFHIYHSSDGNKWRLGSGQ